MEFPGGSDNYLTITGPSHPFLSGAETFHTPSLGDEEFEIPPISLDSDPSLAVSDVVGHFDDLADPSSSQDGSFSAQYGVQTLDMPVGMTHGLMEQGGGLLSGGLTMDLDHSIGTQYSANPPVTIDVPMTDMTSGLMGHSQLTTIDQSELSSQLGLSLGGGTILPPAQSPEDRLSTTPSPTSSLHEDGVEEFRRQLPSQKTVVVEAGKSRRLQRREKRKILMNLKNQFQHMLCSFVTHKLPSRDRIPMPLLGRFQKLWPPCGTVLERSKSRCTRGKLKLPRKSI